MIFTELVAPEAPHIHHSKGKSMLNTMHNVACVQGSTNGTNGIPISFKVLPMVPLVLPMVPLVIPLGTNGNTNGTIGPPNGTIGTNGKPMVPLATNGTIGVKFPMVPLGEP